MGSNLCCMARGDDPNQRKNIDAFVDEPTDTPNRQVEPIEDVLPVSSPPKPRKSLSPDHPSTKRSAAHEVPPMEEDEEAKSSPNRSELGEERESVRSSTGGKPRSSFGAAGGTYNMLIIGKKGSGKSSFMARFTRDKHPGKVRPTANKNIKSKNIDLSSGGKARTRLYEVPAKDIATQGKASQAILYIIDLTDQSSIQAAKDLIDEHNENFKEGAHHIAIGCKSDEKEREINPTEFQNFANEVADQGFELSAHTGDGYGEFHPYIEEKITNYLQS